MSTKLRTADDVNDYITAIMERVTSGKMPVDVAHIQIRAANTLNTAITTRVEFARLTGRLERGSDVMPGYILDSKATPTKKAPPPVQPKATKKAGKPAL